MTLVLRRLLDSMADVMVVSYVLAGRAPDLEALRNEVAAIFAGVMGGRETFNNADLRLAYVRVLERGLAVLNGTENTTPPPRR